MNNNWVKDVFLLENEKVALNGEETNDAEGELNFSFPDGFKELYLNVDGFKDWPPNMFSIWPLERIFEKYKGDGKKEFICFADCLINSHQIGFSKNMRGIFIVSEYPDFISDTFVEVIEPINSNSDKIY